VRDDPRKGVDVHCFAGCDWRDVKVALGLRRGATALQPVAPPPDERKDITPALTLWAQSVPLQGTLGEEYFTRHRKLTLGGNLDHALRYNKLHRMVVALMTEHALRHPPNIFER
jgi:hypothetical protein